MESYKNVVMQQSFVHYQFLCKLRDSKCAYAIFCVVLAKPFIHINIWIVSVFPISLIKAVSMALFLYNNLGFDGETRMTLITTNLKSMNCLRNSRDALWIPSAMYLWSEHWLKIFHNNVTCSEQSGPICKETRAGILHIYELFTTQNN